MRKEQSSRKTREAVYKDLGIAFDKISAGAREEILRCAITEKVFSKELNLNFEDSVGWSIIFIIIVLSEQQVILQFVVVLQQSLS